MRTATLTTAAGRTTAQNPPSVPAVPAGGARRFRRIDAGGFALFLDMGGQPLPGTLVLELRGRRGKIAAFWNDQAWVG